MSFTIAHKLDAPIELSIACAAVGAMPDLIGLAGGSMKGDWKIYNWAHKTFSLLWLLPPYLLHLIMDYPSHIQDEKYWWHCEILSYIIIGTLWLV